MATLTTLVGDFAEFCRANQLCSPLEKILIAVSGGVDSMVLLDLFSKIRGEWSLDIGVIHVNHQLRGGESMGDEEFVRQAAERSLLPFYVKRVDTLELKHSMRVSKQVAAREARYQFFEETRLRTNANRVATGHQTDDNAETVLFNALRGTGIRGLAGIPPSRNSGHYVRPLLFTGRERILEYARANGIQFRNDSSNATDVYSRNYLRHAVIPFLQETLGPVPATSLNRLSNSMRRLGLSLDSFVETLLPELAQFHPGVCDIFLPIFCTTPRFLQQEIVLRAFRHLRVEPSIIKVDKIVDFCTRQSGHYLTVKEDIIVERNRDHLLFSPASEQNVFSITVAMGHSYSLGHFTFSLENPGAVPSGFSGDGYTEYIDADKIREPLALRSWRYGDWFVPLGMSGRKKLSDYFGDAKIPRFEKKGIPVLESNGNIVWVCGRRLDDRYKITDQTTHAVKLTYTPTTSPVN